MLMSKMGESRTNHQQRQHRQDQEPVELFLAVPGGLEDVAVRRLPAPLVDSATHIHYQIGSGYISLRFGSLHIVPDNNGNDKCGRGSESGSGDHTLAKVIADLVSHPPLCIFAAYVSLGEIGIPRQLFDSPPKDLLEYCMNGFDYPSTIATTATTPQGSTAEPAGAAPLSSALPPDSRTIAEGGRGVGGGREDLGLRWRQGLSVLQLCSPATLSEGLASSRETLTHSAGSFSKEGIRGDSDHSSGNCSDSGGTTSIRYRASFDRGDVQHKGIRSQDLAAALGGLTGDTFPSWRVKLKEFDVEVMGRWIQGGLEETQYKSPSTSQPDPLSSARDGDGSGDTGSSNGRPRIEQGAEERRQQQQQQHRQGEVVRMQVGLTLPLALSTCPYRFRPLDGRTSLRIEIAYTLLALADPQPGEVVMDICSGVGTIPIVGAVHYPGSLFTGLEVLPYNVERAAQNAKEMIERVDKERKEEQQTKYGISIARSPRGLRPPNMLVGDARAVCWRPGSVDLVVSGTFSETASAIFMFCCVIMIIIIIIFCRQKSPPPNLPPATV